MAIHTDLPTSNNYHLSGYYLNPLNGSLKSALIRAIFSDKTKTIEECGEISPEMILGTVDQIFFFDFPL